MTAIPAQTAVALAIVACACGYLARELTRRVTRARRRGPRCGATCGCDTAPEIRHHSATADIH